MAKKNKSKSDKQKPSVHKQLKNLDIQVNEMGQIVKNYDVDELNTFLNENVEDKKLDNEDEADS